MADKDFDAKVKELLSTKYLAGLEKLYVECKQRIADTDFKAMMLEALDHGYAAFSISRDDMALFTAVQRDDLIADISDKAKPLNMSSYNFIVMPVALQDFTRAHGIGHFISYFHE